MRALSIIAAYAMIFGVATQADEGTAAHLWQILMAGQLPIILFFALKWLPAKPKGASWSSQSGLRRPGRHVPCLAVPVVSASGR